MTERPTRESVEGRIYLALRSKARAQGRATDELLRLFALEAFVDRLAGSSIAQQTAIKGGVLLAAYDLRRPTRDVDVYAQGVQLDVHSARSLVDLVLTEPRADGWRFETTKAEVIREAAPYSGVRVTVPCTLATARVSFHVDLNVGDAVWPAPRVVELPRLLGGQIAVRGYGLAMVVAEKMVTALERGTANTRWRDFADVYLIARRHRMDGDELSGSLRHVANFRGATLMALTDALSGYAARAQTKWATWVQNEQLGDRLPRDFASVLTDVSSFIDPVLGGLDRQSFWDPAMRAWSGPHD